jgi:hypothetical protein
MKVSREKLLSALEFCAPGLSEREIVEQSSCFILKDRNIVTYDSETACSYPSPLDSSFEGAVKAEPLRAILHKMKENTIEVTQSRSELLVKGKNRRVGIAMEKNIELPLDSLESPSDWKPLPDNFTDAVEFVKDCAGRDDANFYLTCVHIHPRWIEAFDNYQFARYKIRVDIEQDLLIRQVALKNILNLNMVEFSESENWIHFRNSDNLMLSCRRYMDEYKNLSKIAKYQGSKITLPKSLKEAATRAEVFSVDSPDDNQVRVDLTPGWIKVKGTGRYGWYTERRKINYSKKAISFRIQPTMLVRLLDQQTECQISDKALKAEIGTAVFVVSLTAIDSKEV